MKLSRLGSALGAALCCLLPLSLASAQKNQRLLTIQDVSSTLAGLVANTPFDFVGRSKVYYGVTGVYSYDQFFRNAAITYGGFLFGQRLFDDATGTLKRFARSKAAVAELQDEIKALTNGADTTNWSTEQSIAVLKAAKKKGEISADERFYLAATSALVAATVPVLRASVTAAPNLARQAPPLVKGAPSQLDILQAPAVVVSVNRSAQQLQAIPRQGTSLLESFVVLSRGLQALTSE